MFLSFQPSNTRTQTDADILAAQTFATSLNSSVNCEHIRSADYKQTKYALRAASEEARDGLNTQNSKDGSFRRRNGSWAIAQLSIESGYTPALSN